MMTWIIIAVVSIAICAFLWFRDVKRIMRERMSMVVSSAGQLSSSRREHERIGSTNTKIVLERSESIFEQARALYNETLNKTYVMLPARIMGFGPVTDNPELYKDSKTDDDEVKDMDYFAEFEKDEVTVKQLQEKDGYIGSVRFFKNLILLGVIVLITVPTGLAIHFASDLRDTESKLQEMTSLHDEISAIDDDMHELSADSPYADLYPDFYAPQAVTANVREDNVIYLTFDDGPSERTAEVLDILKEKDVKATFFVVGTQAANNHEMLKRIVDEGHTIAMHTYTHNYTQIYASVEAYLDDMYLVFSEVKTATGVEPSLFRFPGGSINNYNSGIYQELIAEMLRRGFVPYDWNISSQDAAGGGIPQSTILNNVINGAGNVSSGIVLMHDSASKVTTVEALGPMIDELLNMGYELKALTPDVKPVLFAYGF